MKKTEPFFVGTYSTSGPYVPEANGNGIISCNLDLKTGEIQMMQVYKENINATYLAKDNLGHLFVACDNFEEHGEVKAFRIKDDFSLKLLSTCSTHGSSSCHVEYDENGKRIFISSYAGGLLSVHSFENNNINQEPQLLNYEGSGPNQDRQESAHIHQAVISPDKNWLYACDLGSDTIWLHDLLKEKIQVKTNISTPAGSGPRHLVCHPYLPLVYVFCELNARLLTYSTDLTTGVWKLLNILPTLPESFKGEPAGAAIKIHPGTKALYVSNRNHHSLTAFSVSENGNLDYHSNFSIHGEEPRDFSIDPSGQWLLSANQNSHNIIPFRLDPKSGLPLGLKGPEFKCGTPVCILF